MDVTLFTRFISQGHQLLLLLGQALGFSAIQPALVRIPLNPARSSRRRS